MKVQLVIAIAFAALAIPARAAEAPSPPARPEHIEEAQWVPLGETFGFVITDDLKMITTTDKSGKRSEIAHKAPPPVTGYFVIRREGIWCRANVENLPISSLLPER